MLTPDTTPLVDPPPIHLSQADRELVLRARIAELEAELRARDDFLAIAAHELRQGLRPDRFTITTMSDRLKKQGDLWADFWKERQALETAVEKLQRER